MVYLSFGSYVGVVYPKRVHSLLNVEFLPKILKTVQAVDMRRHSSLNNRTRNFSCDSATLILGAGQCRWTSNILQENKWFSKAFQVHPVFTILQPVTIHYYPLLHHSLLLHHPPAAVGILFFWSINMSINRPFSLRSTPLMLQLLESERSDIFSNTEIPKRHVSGCRDLLSFG